MQQIDTWLPVRSFWQGLLINQGFICSFVCVLLAQPAWGFDPLEGDAHYAQEKKRQLASLSPLKRTPALRIKTSSHAHTRKSTLETHGELKSNNLSSANRYLDFPQKALSFFNRLDREAYYSVHLAAWRIRRFISHKFEHSLNFLAKILRQFQSQLTITPLGSPYLNNK